jgi:hypothetical protein
MGNNPSRPPPSSSISGSSHGAGSLPARREPRRRESVNTLTSTKATVAEPSLATFEATAHKPTAHQSTPITQPKYAKTSTVESPTQRECASGNEQSRERRPPHPPGQFVSSKPVNVPALPESTSRYDHTQIQPSAPPPFTYQLPLSQTQRPPRLPLPIEEEIHTPGSPIITPADVRSTVLDLDSTEEFPRPTSVLSSTIDDEELTDGLQTCAASDSRGGTIPTLVEWNGPGDKIYVTGTFVTWSRKFRLNRKWVHDHGASLFFFPELHDYV